MEENQNSVLNNNQENDENKKKKKIVVWWNNLGKGVRTAICILGGVAVATAVVVPTVFGVKACTNTQRKYSVNSDEVNFTGKLENDTFEGTITVKDSNKDITKIEVKIGTYVLNDTEYTFDEETGKITITSDIIKAHNGDIVITPTVAGKPEEIKFHFNGESNDVGDYSLDGEAINLIKDKRYFFKLDMSNFKNYNLEFKIYTEQDNENAIINSHALVYTYRYMSDIKISSDMCKFSKLATGSPLSNPYTYAFNNEDKDGSQVNIASNSFSDDYKYLTAVFTCGLSFDNLRIFISANS